MKSALLVVLLAAAATAAVISNEVPDVVRVPDVADVGEVADVEAYELPEALVSETNELIDPADLPADARVAQPKGDLNDEVAQYEAGSRSDLDQDSVGFRNTRVFSGEYRVNGIAGRIQERIVRVTTNRAISLVRLTRIGAAQGSTVTITTGGVGSTSVSVRIRSAVGRGYHFRIEVFVR
ncbi:hypothetical protein PYW07_009520 [Mythimna separata]|uniref:Uncharacterized protein n=1 Tax=Mythimna separata TaxID=271217 RepID=A0AAD7YC51_MYTSE|nr:hypothetical protein PYW07_009520 [Mythimna separata]